MATKQRKLTILKRAEMKKSSTAYDVQAGDLMFLVENDQEDVYTVTLRNNGHHTCTCTGNAKWHKKCYHISHCEHQENIRRESAVLAPEFAAAKVPTWVIWLVESGVLAVPAKAVKVVEMPAQKVVSSKVIDISQKRQMLEAPLNGNKSFKDAIAI